MDEPSIVVLSLDAWKNGLVSEHFGSQQWTSPYLTGVEGYNTTSYYFLRTNIINTCLYARNHNIYKMDTYEVFSGVYKNAFCSSVIRSLL